MPNGIVRKIDHLGRACIPKEYRRQLGWAENEPVDMTLNGDSVIIRKVNAGCFLCDDHTELVNVWGKPLCVKCRLSAAKTLQTGHGVYDAR